MEPTEPKRGPGRPPLDPALRRSESLSGSVTPSERDAFAAKAKALGKTVAALARETLLAVLACGVLALGGCGAAQSPSQARDVQATAIDVTGAVLHTVADMVGALAEADANRMCGSTTETEENHGCLEQVLAHWAPADAAIDTVHAALDAWLSGAGGDVVRAVRACVAAYEAMRQTLGGLGVTVPALPEPIKAVLEALAGAASELIPDAGHDAGADAGSDSGA